MLSAEFFLAAFPCLLVEVVGEVVSKYYSGVVEFEFLGGVYVAYGFIPLGCMPSGLFWDFSGSKIFKQTMAYVNA